MPRTVLDIKRRRNNQKVRASIRGERIIVSSVENAPLTLEQRLAAYDPKRHGGEQMTRRRDSEPSGGDSCYSFHSKKKRVFA